MNRKMILYIIGIAVLSVLVYGLFQASKLKTIRITKSVTINGSKQEVFDMVRYLRNFPKWSPFLVADPSQKYHVEGTDGYVGAQYHWNGNKGKDLGYQEIVKIDPLSFIGMRCDIQKPFKAAPTFDYTFSGSNGNVKVTQDFRLESGLVDAFFMWIFGAKKEMENTNEKGMKLLKAAVEAQ